MKCAETKHLGEPRISLYDSKHGTRNLIMASGVSDQELARLVSHLSASSSTACAAAAQEVRKTDDT